MTTGGMTFSDALKDLKNGFRLTRDAWATVRYVVIQPGYPQGIPINGNTAAATRQPEGTVCVFRPYLMGQHTDGTFGPWVPSIGDLLAEDWHILPDEPLTYGEASPTVK